MITWLDLEMMLKIVLAMSLGGVIGFERERIHRPAGLRTHMLVSAGATAFTIVSIYGFVGHGTTLDPARVAAQIVTGIGFLGAGTIFRTESTVRGLTTASSIWLVAAIGMLVGTGLYWLAVFTTILSALVLLFLRIPERRGGRPRVGEPSLLGEDGSGENDSSSR